MLDLPPISSNIKQEQVCKSQTTVRNNKVFVFVNCGLYIYMVEVRYMGVVYGHHTCTFHHGANLRSVAIQITLPALEHRSIIYEKVLMLQNSHLWNCFTIETSMQSFDSVHFLQFLFYNPQSQLKIEITISCNFNFINEKDNNVAKMGCVECVWTASSLFCFSHIKLVSFYDE